MSSTAAAGTRSYFLEDHSDEVVPCDCTLEGWASWLAGGGDPITSWTVEVPADGQVFEGNATLWQADIVATFDGETWHLSREPSGDFCAVRFGEGLGWDCDAIVGATCDEIVEFLTENADDAVSGQTEFIATGQHEPGYRFTFRAGPPPRLDAERVQ